MAKKDLDVLFPIDREVILGGQKFIIREFRAKEFSDVIALGSALSSSEGIAEALAKDSDRLFRLLSSTTDVPVPIIEKMRLSALAEVVAQIMEENADFFVHSLPSVINRVVGAVTTKTGQK